MRLFPEFHSRYPSPWPQCLYCSSVGSSACPGCGYTGTLDIALQRLNNLLQAFTKNESVLIEPRLWSEMAMAPLALAKGCSDPPGSTCTTQPNSSPPSTGSFEFISQQYDAVQLTLSTTKTL